MLVLGADLEHGRVGGLVVEPEHRRRAAVGARLGRRRVPSRAAARPAPARRPARGPGRRAAAPASGIRPKRGSTTKLFTAIPRCVRIDACADVERVQREHAGGAVQHADARRARRRRPRRSRTTTASSPGLGQRAPLVVERRRVGGGSAPCSTARARRTRSAIRPAFQSLQAAGPVAAASAIGQRVQQVEQLGRAADRVGDDRRS